MAGGDDDVQMHRVEMIQSNDPKAATIKEHGDAALDFLENHETVTFTREEEKRLIRKIDRVLMPLVR